MSGLPQCEELERRTYQCDFVATLSPLWHPFVGPARVAPHSTGFILVVLLAVARLIAPSVQILWRLLRARSAALPARRSGLAGWRL